MTCRFVWARGMPASRFALRLMNCSWPDKMQVTHTETGLTGPLPQPETKFMKFINFGYFNEFWVGEFDEILAILQPEAFFIKIKNS